MEYQPMPHSSEYDAYRNRGDVDPGLFDLLGRLRSYVVRWWTAEAPEHEQYEPGMDRIPEQLQFSNVVSSQLADDIVTRTLQSVGLEGKRHAVAIDLDIPAYLVPSTTPGHSHLYVDVPGGIAHDDYMDLLEVLGRCGVIEEGYAEVSRKRGHSDLRPPWIKKEPVAEPVVAAVSDWDF